MADRRKRVKQGLEAVLKSTTEPDRASEEAPPETAAAEEEMAGPGASASYRTARPVAKRHTSVYLYPAEFEMLDDIIYSMRKNHGIRLAKSDLWRALLYIALRMLDDPERADELLRECGDVGERESTS